MCLNDNEIMDDYKMSTKNCLILFKKTICKCICKNDYFKYVLKTVFVPVLYMVHLMFYKAVGYSLLIIK